MNSTYNLFGFETISPISISNPQTPYFEWISDIYGIDVITKIDKKPVKPDPPTPQSLYIYVGSDGQAYLDTDNKVYAAKKGE